MTDSLSKQDRSDRMRCITSKNTRPEMIVRKTVHAMGYRYRLHQRNLPGSPDLVFPSRRKVIFIHGCFWHRHGDPLCKLSRLPKTRLDFWLPKLEANAQRDTLALANLDILGWSALVLWECELKDRASLQSRIGRFLDDAIN